MFSNWKFGDETLRMPTLVILIFCSFCLEAKEPKVQDLETPAKNFKNFLKSPNSRLAISKACSNSGYFLTEIFQIFFTPPFPRSIFTTILFKVIARSEATKQSYDRFTSLRFVLNDQQLIQALVFLAPIATASFCVA